MVSRAPGRTTLSLPHPMNIPSRTEALALLEQYQNHKPGRKEHSIAVADLALRLARMLVTNGTSLNLPLIEAAALLHDIRKGEPEHDRVGGDLLRSLGYPEVAAVAEVHTRLGGRIPAPGDPILEDEVVYMADKSYRGTRLVSIEERYGIWKKTWEADPEKLASLNHGEQRALTVKGRIEKAMGRTLEEVAPST